MLRQDDSVQPGHPPVPGMSPGMGPEYQQYPPYQYGPPPNMAAQPPAPPYQTYPGHLQNYTLQPGNRASSHLDTPKSSMTPGPGIPYPAAHPASIPPNSYRHQHQHQHQHYQQPPMAYHPHIQQPSSIIPPSQIAPNPQGIPMLTSAGPLHAPGSLADPSASSSSGSGTAKKRRGNLPRQVTEILRKWLSDHIEHPYPTDEEKQQLIKQTGLTLNQLSNWFINARRRRLPALQNKTQTSSHQGSSS